MGETNSELRRLIAHAKGEQEADKYLQFKLSSYTDILESAKSLLHIVPPSFGECVLLSASWAGHLKDKYGIPAVVVAGDLQLSGYHIFKYDRALPKPTKTNRIIEMTWSGHCWIEVGGLIGDLSIFRTAYAAKDPSRLKNYVVGTFGVGRGALICPSADLPQGLEYVRREVLSEEQVSMFTASMAYKLEQRNIGNAG